MTKVTLRYNPYTKSKELSINGEKQESDVVKNICGGEDGELSQWCEKFYENVLAETNDSFEVEFSGIERDFEFMEDGLDKFLAKHRDASAKLIKGEIVVVADKLIELKELFAKMQRETPFESLRSDELKTLFEKATNSEFEMAVVATMSSGKSTLINAVLGRELLPARNEATTATIAKIHDVDGMEHFRAISYDADGNELTVCDPLTPENMEELNNIDKAPTSRIEIYGDIPGIESKNIQLVLTDTPGPNNSRTSEHQKHTMDLLNADYKPMIIYVLNGTQLETNDDSLLLSKVSKLIKSGDRQSRDRFLFVLNKADEFDPDKGESVARKIDDVKRYLSSKHGIENPRVFPTAARLAKQIRQVANADPSLTNKDRRQVKTDVGGFVDDERLHFSNFAEFLSPKTKRELENKISLARGTQNENEEALFYTGVPSVEMAITEYLTKYALPAKIAEGVYSFKDKLEALNVEANEKNTLANNENRVKELQANLEQIKRVLAKGDEAKKAKMTIANLTTESELKRAIAKSGAEFLQSVTHELQNMRNNSLAVETARAYMQNLKFIIPMTTANFTSQIEKSLNDVLSVQAKKCVDNYKKYVEELVGAVGYEMPEVILGDVATITVDEALSAYTRNVESGRKRVGTRTRSRGNKNKAWYKPWTWGDDSYETWEEDVYETTYEEKVNFSNFIDQRVFPKIEQFEKETRELATKSAREEEAKFKAFFLEKLDELDDRIKEKIDEQKSALRNQKEFEEMITQNRQRLAWLESFKKELDNILK